jgi:hypothetical protein
MDRSVEQQTRSLPDRNLAGPRPGEGPTPDPHEAPTDGLLRRRRPFVYATAAMVLLLAGLAAALVWGRDGSTTTGASGTPTYLIPPADATDVSGSQVEGGSTLDFTVDGQPFQLVQVGNAGNRTPESEMERTLESSGGEPVTVEGIGTVRVLCAAAAPSDDGGRPAATTAALWFDAPLQVHLSARGDTTGALCGDGDLASAPLVDMVRRLRDVGEPEWERYVREHAIEIAEDSAPSGQACIGAGQGSVCATRDGGLRITASGLAPGSPFTYEVRSADQPEPLTQELVVTSAGELPGAIAIFSAFGAPMTITVSAVSADGQPIDGPLEVR